MSTDLLSLWLSDPSSSIEITRFYGGDARGVMLSMRVESDNWPEIRRNVVEINLAEAKELLATLQEFVEYAEESKKC